MTNPGRGWKGETLKCLLRLLCLAPFASSQVTVAIPESLSRQASASAQAP